MRAWKSSKKWMSGEKVFIQGQNKSYSDTDAAAGAAAAASAAASAVCILSCTYRGARSAPLIAT